MTSAGGSDAAAAPLQTARRRRERAPRGGVCWEHGEAPARVEQMSSFQRENDAAKSLFRRLEVLYVIQ